MISVQRAGAGARALAWGRALLVVAIVVGLDQLTKHLITDGIAVDRSRSVLPGLHFVHVLNPGVAFGFLSGGGAIVLVFSGVALSVLAAYLTLRPLRRLLWL